MAEFGNAIYPLALDVTNNEQVEQAVDAAVKHFGRLDVVVNNAGYGDLAAVEDVTLEDFRAQIDTNFYGVVYVSKAVVPVLRRQGSGHIFEPVRYTALHAWHVKNGAEFEDVGQWKRPWYFPRNGEDLHAAVKRECLAVRDSVGLLDASTLGKIDIQGPDAREFLNRIYSNAWTKLDVGKARYGLMCKEDGMVFDDGVTACLADNHFLMTTTTGGAARVLQWLEIYQQTEWPDLKVYFTSVTDHWATLTQSGPNSRKLLSEVTDIDLDREAFPNR